MPFKKEFEEISEGANLTVADSIEHVLIAQITRAEDVITSDLLRYLIEKWGADRVTTSRHEPQNGSDIILAFRDLSNGRQTFYISIQSKNARPSNLKHSKISTNLAYKGSRKGVRKVLAKLNNSVTEPERRYHIQLLSNLLPTRFLTQLRTQYHVSKAIGNVLPIYFFYCFWKNPSPEIDRDMSLLLASTETLLEHDNLVDTYCKLEDLRHCLYTLKGQNISTLIFDEHGVIGDTRFLKLFDFFKSTIKIKKTASHISTDAISPRIDRSHHRGEAGKYFDELKRLSESDLSRSNKENFEFKIEKDDSRIEKIKTLGLPVYIFDFESNVEKSILKKFNSKK